MVPYEFKNQVGVEPFPNKIFDVQPKKLDDQYQQGDKESGDERPYKCAKDEFIKFADHLALQLYEPDKNNAFAKGDAVADQCRLDFNKERHHEKSLAAISKIIGHESLAYWANWPDFIKSDTTHKWDSANVWDYVDLPGNISKTEFEAGLKSLHGKNLYTQILYFSSVLKDVSKPWNEV